MTLLPKPLACIVHRWFYNKRASICVLKRKKLTPRTHCLTSFTGLYVARRGECRLRVHAGFSMRLRESAGKKESSVFRPKRGLHRRPRRRPDLMGATLGLQAVRPQHLTLPCFLDVEGLDSVLPAELSVCPDKAGIPCPPGPCPHQPLSPADTFLCQQAAVGDKDSAARGCKDPACSRTIPEPLSTTSNPRYH